MKEEVCFLQMCCENSPYEVEGTLENEEHMMEPDAEDESASLLTCHIKKRQKKKQKKKMQVAQVTATVYREKHK